LQDFKGEQMDQHSPGSIPDPATYDAWYHSPRGRWIGECEFILLRNLLGANADTSLLDVGCGTGYFSRRFAQLGLSVTGIDSDYATLRFAKTQGGNINYMQSNALALPFPNNAFDCTMAVTSLCFVSKPLLAFREMWRVTDHALVIGLLNRHSLLYWRKRGRGGYAGARWDTARKVLKEWIPMLSPSPEIVEFRSAVFLPQGTGMAKWGEQWLPDTLCWGGFLAVGLKK
jgi:SAM-dependent methyltransferase